MLAKANPNESNMLKSPEAGPLQSASGFSFMKEISQIELWLWGGNVLAQSLLFVRIASTGYLRKYRAFAFALICSLVFTGALYATSFFELSRFAYSTVYMANLYFTPITYFLWIQELFRFTLQPFGAIRETARGTLRLLLVVLMVSGVCWYLYLSSHLSNGPVAITSALRYHQTCAFGFALYLLFFLAFVSFMPVPMTANLLLHCFCTGGYFLLVGVKGLLVGVFDFNQFRGPVSQLQMGLGVLLYLTWFVRWQPQGEIGLNIASGPLDSEGSQDLLERMQALDRRLERSGARLLR
jgi:hypothetical protein